MSTEIIYDSKIWHLWSALYLYNGSTYSLEFYAENEEDAKERIKAMRESLSDGHQILEEIHVDNNPNFDPDDYLDKLKGK